MPGSYRLPISCALTGDNYVVQVQIGSTAAPASLVVDTGSSAMAVNANSYDPGQDIQAVTGNLAQSLYYLAGINVLGAVVQTGITLTPSAGVPQIFPAVDLAVNYAAGASAFGAAQGILGLAYKSGDPAYSMPGNSWQNKYIRQQVEGAPQNQTLTPFLDQAAIAGALECAFAIGVSRSLSSHVSASANSGILVLGADEAGCADLYQGPLSYAQVIAASQYNTLLVSVQVGTQPVIPVPAPPSWAGAASNSIVDSGTANLTLSSTLYPQVMAAFNAINPQFGAALSSYANGTGSCDQTTINLASWPSLTVTLQDTNSGAFSISVAPQDYWQFDAKGAGQAVAMFVNDSQGELGGASILGLPVFAGNFVLFDRASAGEPGRIGFARLR